MNVRLLKAKRIEKDMLQRDLAEALSITEKSMCHKECSEENRFKAKEMAILTRVLGLSLREFDDIFFDGELTKWLKT